MPTVINKSQSSSTKLDGPPPSSPIVQMTITSFVDLGMVKVDPAYPRQDGKTEVHKVEYVFTSPAGEQAKKDYTASIHEKAALTGLVIASTGNPPGDSFDAESLVGKNVQVIGALKTSKKGNKYFKITNVVPAAAGQVTAKAPVPKPAEPAKAPATQQVGW